ncbi:MAG: YqiJ family protein [Desulfobulbaceae bacterium]|nr:YqiJ family protein [Desulfobulbaceae bacterium]
MFEFIFAPENLPFSVAIALMLLMAIFEVVGLMLGAGLSQVMDSLLPDIDIELDVDAPDIESPSVFVALLGWLRVGQVPAYALLVVFLTSYGMIGYAVQGAVFKVFGMFLPTFIAGIGAFFLSLPMVRLFGGALAKIIPKDETYAVSEDKFIGRAAVITLGKAVVGKPASGRLKDHYGTTHYVMVEPDQEDEEFVQGDSVILVSRNGPLFKAIHNTKGVLVDEELNN